MPLKAVRILPFNHNHAQKAGKFAKCIYEVRDKHKLEIQGRILIPNDTKLFAQADTEEYIDAFVTSDLKSRSLIDLLKTSEKARFVHIDLNTPHNQALGTLF